MPAPIVTFLIWVGSKAAEKAADAIVSKLVSVPVDKALGIEVQGASISAWGETMVLAIFAGGSMRPEPTFEQKVSERFRDLDVAEIRLQGPSFPDPIKIYDDYDETLDITRPGEYILKGAYQLNVQLPNPGLGGRPISVEIQATLTAVT